MIIFIDSPTVVMKFQEKVQSKKFFSQNQNEPIYNTINEYLGDINYNKCSNKKENYYMVIFSHTELSKGKLQVCKQNEVTTKKIENDYVEMLSTYVNLRFL